MGYGLGELDQLVLLAILRLKEDAYGVAVQAEIAGHSDRVVSLGAVYATLMRLEEQGLVTSRMGAPTPTRGGRRKKLYSVCAAGRVALRTSLSVLRSMSRGLTPLLERP